MFNGGSRNADKFVVRLPDGMRERIAEIAKNNHRSMNSEVIFRLGESIAADDPAVAGIESDQLSNEEKELVASARKLPAWKRKALLTLMFVDEYGQ